MAANDIVLKRRNAGDTGSLEEVKTPAEVGTILGTVMKADYTAADVVLVGTGVGTAGAVTLGASEILGKKATGAATSLTATEVRTIINVENGADVTDATNVVAALDGATLPTATVAATDKVLVKDTDGSDALKTVTAQAIADLVAGGASFAANVETLAANKTIADGDPEVQLLNSGGANRDVYLPATPAADCRFTIVNMASYTLGHYLQVLISGDSNSFTRLYAANSATFVFDKTDGLWRCIGPGFQRTRTAANTYDSGSCNTALGYRANASDEGVAVGESANGSADGVAVGCAANGANFGVAVGLGAACTNKTYGSAIGVRSKQQRYGGHAISGDHLIATRLQREEVIWKGDTTDATATEIFLHGVASNRCTILAESAVAFHGIAVAKEKATGDSKIWEFQGGIKRDASNNTALIGAVTTTVVAEDAGASAWTLALTADDTNESLLPTVTGEAEHTIRWGLQLVLLDLVFS